MKEIKWTSDLSVGIELIYEQHKLLIKNLNDLNKALELQQGPAKIAATLPQNKFIKVIRLGI